MFILLIESIIVGIITSIIGIIIFDLSINKDNKDEIKPYGIDLAFFTTGLFLYLIFEKDLFNNLFHKK